MYLGEEVVGERAVPPAVVGVVAVKEVEDGALEVVAQGDGGALVALVVLQPLNLLRDDDATGTWRLRNESFYFRLRGWVQHQASCAPPPDPED